MENFDDLFTSKTGRRQGAPFDKDAWAAKKQAERERIYGLIDRYALDMGGDGGLFQKYLDVQAHFDRYSVSNAILVASQMPEATRLASYDGWKANGEYVRRGADAISILEPGKEYTRDDGSVGVSCNVKKVFDISQTSAAGSATPAAPRDDRLLLKALMNNAPCRFEISNALPENINARYDQERNTIFVRQGLDAPTIFRGVAQELARAHMSRGNLQCEHPGFVAYSAAYMLCRRSHVVAAGFSFDRLPEQYSKLDAQAIRAEAGTIRELAGEITTDMNRFFAAQERAQKNRDSGAR